MADDVVSAEDEELQPLKPLKIKCTSSNCDAGLHCFRATRKMKKLNQQGKCRSCGTALVDWKRVAKRDLGDSAYTFEALKLEMVRHHFWHVEIDEKARIGAFRKGKAGLRIAAQKRIRSSVGKAEPFKDGTQTGYEGNILFYGQHATASCCRACIEYWHGIPRGRELSDVEVSYLSNLLILFINDRMPELPEEGVGIPLTVRYPRGSGSPVSR